MKTIDAVKMRSMRNDEHFQFMTEVHKLIEAETAEKLGVGNLFTAFCDALAAEDAALKVERGSAVTKSVTDTDALRDQLLKGLYMLVEGFGFHYSTAVQESARRIGRILNQYGILHTLPYNEESSAITNLMHELTSANYSPDLAALNLTDWCNHLSQVNNDFIRLFNDRVNDEAFRNSGNVRQIRVAATDAYMAIVKRINAQVEVFGDSQYSNLIDKLNHFIAYYNSSITARQGRGKDSEEDGPKPSTDKPNA